MSTIDAVGGASGIYTATETSDMFLELLMTEIRYQDPLDPMDSSQYINQLSQLSSLEEMQEVNANLEEQMLYTQSMNNTAMLSLVGQKATVPGDTAVVAGGETSGSRIYAAANSVATVNVVDAEGNVVDTYTRDLTAGWNDITWDGVGSDGNTAADGEYTLEFDVRDGAGNDIEFYSYMNRLVESIRFENNLALVSIGGSEFYASDVIEVGL